LWGGNREHQGQEQQDTEMTGMAGMAGKRLQPEPHNPDPPPPLQATACRVDEGCKDQDQDGMGMEHTRHRGQDR